MHINFSNGEHNDKSIAMCYNYIKEKYIKEKVVQANDGNSCFSNIRKSEHRAAGY